METNDVPPLAAPTSVPGLHSRALRVVGGTGRNSRPTTPVTTRFAPAREQRDPGGHTRSSSLPHSRRAISSRCLGLRPPMPAPGRGVPMNSSEPSSRSGNAFIARADEPVDMSAEAPSSRCGHPRHTSFPRADARGCRNRSGGGGRTGSKRKPASKKSTPT